MPPQQRTILIVDDDHEILESMRTVLENKGFRILAARDGNAGLMIAERENPDLIVLDLMMPEVDGFRFAEELGRDEAWRTIPILVVTARDLSDRERHLLHRYAFRVLDKGAASRGELQDLIHLDAWITDRFPDQMALARLSPRSGGFTPRLRRE